VSFAENKRLIIDYANHFFLVLFQDFEAESAVVQQNPAGNPFSVDIFRGFVRAGVAGSVFINDGGILSIDQLGVIDVTAMSLVSTANLGTTFIDDTDIASSSIEVRRVFRVGIQSLDGGSKLTFAFRIFLADRNLDGEQSED
jgi:hypothetical protein